MKKNNFLKNNPILKAMLTNNHARFKKLQTKSNPIIWQVLKLIPNILHGEKVEPSEYLNNKEIPLGIKFWPQDESKQRQNPAIESLFLVGSLGSIAFNQNSDLDYWLCYYRKNINSKQISVWQKKLNLLSFWVEKNFHIEANFYLVDIELLRDDKILSSFNPLAETEGEVAPLVLLEEIYRNIFHIAGRYPLWWTTDPNINEVEYNIIAQKEANNEFLFDLGFPLQPQAQQYLAAALWLSRKSETDPFKGVIKMITILEQIEGSFKSPRICNLIKENIITNVKIENEQIEPIDPYLFTLRHVLKYAEKHFAKNKDYLYLTRVAVFFKIRGIGAYNQPVELSQGSRKKIILDSFINEWQWKKGQASHLEKYECWPESLQLALGEKTQDMLKVLYVEVFDTLMSKFPGEIDAQIDSLVQLAARLLTRQKGFKATIEPIPSRLHKSVLPKHFTLIEHLDFWGLYGGDFKTLKQAQDEHNNLVYQCKNLGRIAAWLVDNELYNDDKPKLGLSFLSEKENTIFKFHNIKKLCFLIYKIMAPLNWSSLGNKLNWRSEAVGSFLVVANLEQDFEEKHLIGVDFIYRTGWGEMRYLHLDFSDIALEADKYKIVGDAIIETAGESFNINNLNIFIPPESVAQGMITNNLRVTLNSAFQQKIKKDKNITDPGATIIDTF